MALERAPWGMGARGHAHEPSVMLMNLEGCNRQTTISIRFTVGRDA